MVLALKGKFALPSLETADIAVGNPKQEEVEMFKVAPLAKMVPRMNIVDGEGLVLFPSAKLFGLSLAEVAAMKAETVKQSWAA